MHPWHSVNLFVRSERRSLLALPLIAPLLLACEVGTEPGEQDVTLPVETVVIAPGTLALVQGNSAELSAAVEAADGSRLSGRTVTWSSSAPEVASVDDAGSVLAVGAGTATITATSEGVAGTAAVVVDTVRQMPSSQHCGLTGAGGRDELQSVNSTCNIRRPAR